MIDRALIVVGCVLVIGLIGYGLYAVYNPNKSKEDSVFTSSKSLTTNTTNNTNTASNKTDNTGYFDNLEAWTFLGTHKKEAANNIYDALLGAGMENKSIVYCLSDITESGTMHICYVKISKTSLYYQVNILSDYTVTIKEIAQNEIPSQAEVAELEKRTQEAQKSRDNLASNIANDTNPTAESDSRVDSTNTAQQIQLSDTASLARILPANCASLMKDSLTQGMKQSYGFDVVAEASKVHQQTITTTGTKTTFVVQFMDKNQNKLLVNVTYDDSDQTFSGQRIKE